MEIKSGGVSRREQAIRLLAEAAREFEETSHLVLIDSATLVPEESGRATNLMRLPATGPTDTAADLPAMLRAAFNWLIENRAGAAEIWIASDAQRSNWHPEDPRWKDLAGQLGSLTQKVRVRLLRPQPAVRRQRLHLAPGSGAPPAGRQVGTAIRPRSPAQPPRRRTLPVTLTLDGVPTETPVAFEGQSLRWRRRVDLGRAPGGRLGQLRPAGRCQRAGQHRLLCVRPRDGGAGRGGEPFA